MYIIKARIKSNGQYYIVDLSATTQSEAIKLAKKHGRDHYFKSRKGKFKGERILTEKVML